LNKKSPTAPNVSAATARPSSRIPVVPLIASSPPLRHHVFATRHHVFATGAPGRDEDRTSNDERDGDQVQRMAAERCGAADDEDGEQEGAHEDDHDPLLSAYECLPDPGSE
jgi:hypothetical protein